MNIEKRKNMLDAKEKTVEKQLTVIDVWNNYVEVQNKSIDKQARLMSCMTGTKAYLTISSGANTQHIITL